MHRSIQTILLSSMLTLALAGTARADSSGFGARAMGMGGAFSAVADDGTASHWNPAGLAQVKKISITPSLGLQGDWQEALDAYRLTENDQQPVFDGVQAVFDGMIGANLKGIGLNATLRSGLTANQNASSTLISGDGGATASLTLAREFTPLLALGTNIKISRNEYLKFETDSLTPNDPSRNYREEAHALGLAADIGAQLKFGKTLRAGAVIRNIGSDLEFKGTRKNYLDSAEEPLNFTEEIPTSLAVGVAVAPPLKGLLIAGDLEHFTGSGENRLHLGLEKTVYSGLKFRAGVIKSDAADSLEYSAGTGLHAGPASIDLAVLGNSADGLNRIYLSAGFLW